MFHLDTFHDFSLCFLQLVLGRRLWFCR